MIPLMRETSQAFRKLRQAPGFAVAAVLTLALGIGAVSAVFSVMYTLFLRSLPFHDAAQLDSVYMSNPSHPGYEVFSFSYLNFKDIQRQSRFYELGGYSEGPMTLLGNEGPEQINGLYVSENFFRVLGVAPLAGRTFRPEEETPGKEYVAVLSYRLWQRRYHGDPGIIGKPVNVNKSDFTVIGIMPPAFEFYGRQYEMWTPFLVSTWQRFPRGHALIMGVGRRKPGVSREQARVELNGLLRRIGLIDPIFAKDWTIQSQSMRDEYFGTLRTPTLALFGASAFVLIIGCVNVANLLLARMASRKREIAVRIALGASRRDLLRQLGVENLVLALIGCILGLGCAFAGTSLLVSLAPQKSEIPLPERIGIEPVVLLFTIGISLLSTVLFGLAPSLAFSKPNLTVALKEGERGSSGGWRGRKARSLVAFEVALAVLLLVGAGLLLETLRQLRIVNHGYAPDRVLAISMKVPVSPNDPDRRTKVIAFYDDLLRRVRALPGAESVSVAQFLPSSTGWMTGAAIEGRPKGIENRVGAHFEVVSPGYFESLRIPMIRGRSFNEGDRPPATWGVIINETFARRVWPKGDAIGQRISLNVIKPDFSVWHPVIGVVADVRDPVAGKATLPHVYWTYPNWPMPQMSLLIRSDFDPANMVSAVKQKVAEVRSDVPVFEVTTINHYLDDAMWVQRFTSTVVTVFAVAALLLAAVGIYGVMAHAVSQRTREIGLRMALGAQPAEVLRLIIMQGMGPALIGLVCGLAGALALGRVLKSLLYGVGPADALAYSVAAALLAAMALLAAYLPARRATHIDPIIALREE